MSELKQVTPHGVFRHDDLAHLMGRTTMERFLKRHQGRIKGIISGFDGILFKGTFRSISYSSGLEKWLASRRVLQKDFAVFAQSLSSKIIEHAKKFSEKQGRPFRYVASSSASKEDMARQILEEDPVAEGLICVLSCVEPCRSFKLARLSAKKNHFGMRCVERKCLHLYFYFLDREFGLMHVRLQTWLPFTVQVCVNGWEWLAIRLSRAGIGYEKRDNCFADIEDLPRAQELMDSLFQRRWLGLLNRFARIINPWFCCRNPLDLQPYYWTIRQCEYSTDVLFQDTASLRSVYPVLLDHAIHHFHAKDVLRFLGRRVHCTFEGEIKSEFKMRCEGTRIKHWVEENSIKMYDKQACVLRVETTINNPRCWRVWRRVTRKGKRTMSWIPMRKSIADFQRRAEVSRAANTHYLDALSVVGESLLACQVLDPLSRRLIRNGRSYRPLHPVEQKDAAVVTAMSQGEFLLQGFRNKDLRRFLHPEAEADPVRRDKASQRLSRTIRLFREHRLLYKVMRTNRYRLTKRGRMAVAMACKLRESNLLQHAA
jgi:hypothetical protein